MIKLIDEKIERAEALLQPALQAVPFDPGDDARNQIKRERLFDTAIVAVNVESDASLEERPLGGLLPRFQFAWRKRFDFFGEQSSRPARQPVFANHFIE